MLKKPNQKFITISLMCVFVLVTMISFGAVNIKGTYSATTDACYACTNSEKGNYLWGDYSQESSCEIMTVYTTKDTCLVNNCSGTETLDANGNCVDNSGKVTVLFKSGSLTLHKSNCTLENGSCRVALPSHQSTAGWSENPDCSTAISIEQEYITLTLAKTYTYYSCKEVPEGTGSSSNKPSSSSNNNTNNNTNSNNPETGSTLMLVILGGGFLMILYTIYVYQTSMKID